MKKIQLLLFLFVGFFGFSQTEISGTVVDDNGEALIGATVRSNQVPSEGAITDVDGRFVLTVSDATTSISVSYTGYTKQTVQLDGRASYNISLATSQVIEEVVITQYGKEGASPTPGSVAVVDAERIENVPIATFDQILQGQAAGLSIQAGSGQPGEDGNSIRIRGAGSINGSTEPLYILDGIQLEPGEFSNLNPNDFEVAAVLKDAASTSIYGSRGANGVVLLKSKSGQEGRTKIRYTAQFGISEPGEYNFDMMNASELLAFQELAGRGAGWALSPINPANQALTPGEQQARAEELARLRANDQDLRDIFFRTGQQQQHDLSFSGGNEKTRFFTSFSLFDQEGIALRSEFVRQTARLNLDHEVNDKFRIALRSTLASSNQLTIDGSEAVALSNPFAAAYLGNPFETFTEENGNTPWQGNDPNGVNEFAGYAGVNAFDRLNSDSRERKELKGTGVVSFEYDIGQHITLGTRAGLDYRNREFETFTSPNGYGGTLVSRGNNGEYVYTNTNLQTLTVNPTINYFKGFNEDKHFVTGLAGYEYIERTYENRNFNGFDINPLVPGITPGAITYQGPDGEPVAFVGGNNTRSIIASGFATASYTYDNRYEFSGMVRRDANSRFGENARTGNFFSTSLRWFIDEEKFSEDWGIVDQLIFRASYGTSGNQAIGDPFTDQGNFTPLPQLASGVNQGRRVLSLATVPNPDYGWETKKELNLGVDFGLFNRISGALDVFRIENEDLIIRRELSRITGFTRIENFNGGETRRLGAELELNADIVNKDNISWSIGGNVAYVDNEITSLAGLNEYESGTAINRVGVAVGTHYIEGWAGVDPATGNPLYMDGNGGVTNDFNAAPQLADFGSFIPPWVGGFNTNVRWGNLSVYSQFNFFAGNTLFNNQTFFQENPNFAQFNLSRIMNTIWREPGDVTEVQRIGTNRVFSSKDLEDGDFMRWRTLNISYDIPFLASKVNAIQNFNVFANGNNLYTWTNFTGFDPEDENNIQQYNYPLPRTFTVGVNVGL